MTNGDGEAVLVAPRYPRGLRAGLAASTVLHDIAIFVAAVAAFESAPSSLRSSLGAIEWVWICMLLLGSVMGVIGRIAARTSVHIVGCILMAFGLFTWTVAVVTQNPVSSTIPVAAAFFAGGMAMVYRAFASVVKTFLLAK